MSDGYTSLLLEAGINFRNVQIALAFKTRKIAACLITHEHGDHAEYVKQYLNHGITTYMTQGTKDALNINSHRLCTLKAKQELRIGSWSILPFEVEHDAAEPVGYLFKSDYGYKILYLTDTKYVKYKFKGITHMMLEVNYVYEKMLQNVKDGVLHKALSNRVMESHFSLENAVEFLKANDLSKLQQINLIHLSSTNADAERIKNEIQQVSGVPVYIGGN
ncbi:MBL fold metallo-hydrolase [Staphylococcus simulans]|nr:MBL fold metallo-hydrolase [Staphylococcus simulans]